MYKRLINEIKLFKIIKKLIIKYFLCLIINSYWISYCNFYPLF